MRYLTDSVTSIVFQWKHILEFRAVQWHYYIKLVIWKQTNYSKNILVLDTCLASALPRWLNTSLSPPSLYLPTHQFSQTIKFAFKAWWSKKQGRVKKRNTNSSEGCARGPRKAHKFEKGLPSLWLVSQAEVRAEASENFYPLVKRSVLCSPQCSLCEASCPQFSAPSLTPLQKAGFSPAEPRSSNWSSLFETPWKLSSSASSHICNQSRNDKLV